MHRARLTLGTVWMGMVILLVAGCPGTGPGGNDNDNNNANGNDNGNANGNDNSSGQIELRTMAAGLVSPVGMVPDPDGSGRLMVLDQIGLVRIIDEDGELLEAPFLDVRDRLVDLSDDFDERGLLGMAFHPDYFVNGRFFIFYTAPPGPTTPEGFDSQSHISEFSVSANPNAADAESERILLTIDKPQFNHNGGQLAFGPDDGLLYITVGDGGGANDNDFGHTPDIGNAQDKLKLLGKVLRINVDAGDPYSIPDSNPFANQDDALGEIWALGLRNPWRASFDLGGSRRFFVGDAGQDLFEEVHVVAGGGNYGWNIKEGSSCFDPDAPGTPPATCPDTGNDGSPLIDPILEYPHFDDGEAIGVAVIGGYVYRGLEIPALAGKYIFGDYSTGFNAPAGRLFVGTEGAGGTWTMANLVVGDDANGGIGSFLLGFGQDLDGEVYVLTSQVVGPTGTTGRVSKVVPAD